MKIFKFLRNRNEKQKREKALERCRKLSAYTRLKEQFAGTERTKGLVEGDLSFGNLVDICVLYTQAAEGGYEHAKQVLKRIADKQLKALWAAPSQLIDQLFDLKDLGLFYETTYEATLNTYTVAYDRFVHDLTHYPGGLILRPIRPRKDPERYHFILTDRQRADQGKSWIEELFIEVGIPVVSHILK